MIAGKRQSGFATFAAMAVVALSMMCTLSVAMAQTGSGPITNASNGLEGTWQGTVSDGRTELKVIIELKRSGTDFSGSFQVPDRSADILPMSTVTVADRSLRFTFDVPTVWWEGRLNDEGTRLEGKWSNGVSTFPLNFARTAAPPSVKTRVQDPKKPYPYDDKQVRFENRAAQISLAGTLTLPKTAGPFAAVILMGGAGRIDRDGTLYGHHPFLVLADNLTRRGIAVLRVDDRGVGESGGNAESATIDDYASDLEAAIAYLKTRPDIDRKRLGLIGYGEGGCIVPVITAHSSSLALAVLIAGVGVDGKHTLIARSDLAVKPVGAVEEEIKALRRLEIRCLSIMGGIANPEAATSALRSAIATEIAPIPAGRRQRALQEMVAITSSFNTPWMRSFIGYDPVPLLKRTTCPVLLVHGDHDMEMAADLHLSSEEAALKASGNMAVTSATIKLANHMMQPCKTGLPDEYEAIEQTFSADALKTIGEWIELRVK